MANVLLGTAAGDVVALAAVTIAVNCGTAASTRSRQVALARPRESGLDSFHAQASASIRGHEIYRKALPGG